METLAAEEDVKTHLDESDAHDQASVWGGFVEGIDRHNLSINCVKKQTENLFILQQTASPESQERCVSSVQ